MIPFDPQNLFPCVSPETHSYREAQEHSAQVDQHLGFSFQDVEERLLKKNPYLQDDVTVQTWQGLSVQALQTPYSEIRYLLSLLDLKPGQKVIDLGCSYGRMAHVLGAHHPGVEFIGYELVKERVLEGQRILQKFAYPHVRLEARDLASPVFQPERAHGYFIFDFGSRPAIEKTLQDLRRIAQTQPITVVARGRGIRHQIYHSEPWLFQMKEPQVFPHFTIFRS